MQKQMKVEVESIHAKKDAEIALIKQDRGVKC